MSAGKEEREVENLLDKCLEMSQVSSETSMHTFNNFSKFQDR